MGTPLAVGACVGRVIRKFDNGFAVKFAEKQSRDDLVRLIVRTPCCNRPEIGPIDFNSTLTKYWRCRSPAR